MIPNLPLYTLMDLNMKDNGFKSEPLAKMHNSVDEIRMGRTQAGCLKTQKNGRMWRSGEYKIRPYKGFPGGRRGEPRVHPEF